MLNLVPTIRTSYTKKELCKAFILAWQNLFSETPSKKSLAVLFSQIGIETGNTNYCFNSNLGNIKAHDYPNQIIDYMALNNVWEIINGKKVMIPASNPGSWFRSFPDLQSGVSFYIQFLKNNRYRSAWPAVLSGDVAQFAHQLKINGYYTAPEKDYVNGMNRFFTPFLNSTDYEQALLELSSSPVQSEQTTPLIEFEDLLKEPDAPPLQPWVEIDETPLPFAGEITYIPEDK